MPTLMSLPPAARAAAATAAAAAAAAADTMNTDNDSNDGSSTMLLDESSIIENWSFSAAPSRAASSPPARQQQSTQPSASSPPMDDQEPNDGMSQSPLQPHPPDRAGRSDKSVTFDDSITLCSPHLNQNVNFSTNSSRSPALVKHARKSADESLCSDISLMYDEIPGYGHERRRSSSSSRRRRSSSSSHLRRSSPRSQPHLTSKDGMSTPSLPSSSSTPLTPPPTRQERPWPKRDEYLIHHQAKVRAAISKFDLLHPGQLRNYRTMTHDQKARERERVLALLSRIHNQNEINKDDDDGNDSELMSSQQNIHPMNIMRSAHAGRDTRNTVAALDDTRQSPSMRSQDRLVHQAPSSCFSPSLASKSLAAAAAAALPQPPLSSSLREPENDDHDDYDVASSPTRSPPARGVDKSEILLSPEGGTTIDEDDHEQVTSQCNNSNMKNDNENSDVSMNFPIDYDGYHDDYQQDGHKDFRDQDSTSSIELARGTRQYEDHDSIGGRSYTTPEEQIEKPNGSKRQATTSGKRGSNSQRFRNNDHAPIDMMSTRLGRMSISPRRSSPPPNLFPTSQSPISPRLTCSPANEEEDSDNGHSHEGQRISWGRDDDDPKQQSTTSEEDTLMSRSPRSGMNTHRRRRGKRRVPREVPTNVSLVDGATFHLDKLPVKRTEQLERSQPGGATILHRRRLVSFPDPLVRYGSRTRNALKEIFRWIHGAECEFENGKSTIPAVGVFFSLAYQQVIDVSLKLLLDDLPSNKKQYRWKDSLSSSTMKGNTIVVARSKEDCSLWESALRDGTGCSVLNHATLPLSERIRTSTAEKACLHDVVLTTFDAMKSPDVAIPITQKGYVILTNAAKEGGWHSSRTGSQLDGGVTPQKTKQLSVLHRVHYRRIILVDMLGRKCFLAKEGTARNSAVIALSGDSRLAFFSESEADGSSALVALRKSDKRAFKSVSAALHLSEYDGTKNDDEVEDSSDDEDDESRGIKESTLETIALDLKDLR